MKRHPTEVVPNLLTAAALFALFWPAMRFDPEGDRAHGSNGEPVAEANELAVDQPQTAAGQSQPNTPAVSRP